MFKDLERSHWKLVRKGSGEEDGGYAWARQYGLPWLTWLQLLVSARCANSRDQH